MEQQKNDQLAQVLIKYRIFDFARAGGESCKCIGIPTALPRVGRECCQKATECGSIFRSWRKLYAQCDGSWGCVETLSSFIAIRVIQHTELVDGDCRSRKEG